MGELLANDHLFPGPRLLRQQEREFQSALGGNAIIAPTTNVVNDVNCAVTLLYDVNPGETVIISVGTRSGNTIGVVSVTGVPSGASVEILRLDNGGSPSTSLVRLWCGQFVAAGTVITPVLSSAPTRKAMSGWRFSTLANRNAVATSGFVATDVNGSCGTTGLVGLDEIKGVHAAAFTWGGASLTQTAAAGVDEEGQFLAVADIVAGASTPAHHFFEIRDAVTAPHSSMTATATCTTSSAFVGVQAVWSTQPEMIYLPQARPKLGSGRRTSIGPPVLLEQNGYDVAAAAPPVVTPLIQPIVIGQAVQQAAVM